MSMIGLTFIPLTITYCSCSKILFYTDDVTDTPQNMTDQIIDIANIFINEYENEYDVSLQSELMKIRKTVYDAILMEIDIPTFEVLFKDIVTYPYEDVIDCYFIINGTSCSYSYKLLFTNLRYCIASSIRANVDDFIYLIECTCDITISTDAYNTYCGILYTKIITLLDTMCVEIPTFYEIWPKIKNTEYICGVSDISKEILQANWNRNHIDWNYDAD